jgi:hypothetical protein
MVEPNSGASVAPLPRLEAVNDLGKLLNLEVWPQLVGEL